MWVKEVLNIFNILAFIIKNIYTKYFERGGIPWVKDKKMIIYSYSY